jgi:hypothetical protein
VVKKTSKLEKIAIKRLINRFFTNENELILPNTYDDVDIIYKNIGFEIVSGENENELKKLAVAEKLGNNKNLDPELNRIYLENNKHLLTVYDFEEILSDSFKSYIKKIKQMSIRGSYFNKFGLVMNFTEYSLTRDLIESKDHHNKFIQKFLTNRKICPIIYFLFDEY